MIAADDLFAGHRRRLDVGRAVVWIVAGSAISATPVGRLCMVVAFLFGAVRLSARQALTVVLVLSTLLEAPGDRAFSGLWSWPIGDLGAAWFANVSTSVPFVPLPLSPLFMVTIVLLWRCSVGRLGPCCTLIPLASRPAPVLLAAAASSLGACVLWTAYGVIGGGRPDMATLTVVPLITTVGLVLVAQCLGDREWAVLAVWVLVTVAAVRALLCIVVWATVVRSAPTPTLFVTTHADSLLWALGIVIVFAARLEQPGRISALHAATVVAVFAIALVLNTRRLSFLVLVVAAGYVFLSSRWRARRRIARVIPWIAPVLGLYTALALLAPPSPVFAPVQSLESVATGDDSSIQTREAENHNLVRSMKDHGVLGSGFGVPYREYVAGGDISAVFAEFLYLPHNTVLGLMLFVGPLGFTIVLLPLLLATQRAHQVRRRASADADADIRIAAAVAVSSVLAWAVQAWGDLGLTDPHVFVPAAVLIGALSGAVAERVREPTTEPAGGFEAARVGSW